MSSCGLESPFCSQQVPGTPYLEVPTSSSPLNSNVPDIDDQTGSFRLPFGRLTPRSAPDTPGMTVPSPAHQPRNINNPTNISLRKYIEKNKHVETPKREQMVPSCSPKTTIQHPEINSNQLQDSSDVKGLDNSQQISLFTGDDIFA